MPATDPMPMRRASVVVVNYNGGERLQECLRSLLQECDQDDEIILVDNASSDGSPTAAERSFPDVRVIRSAVNLGFGTGNNLGARSTASQYIAFLNPDAVAKPGWLNALIDALVADPGAGLATSKILLLGDPEHINTCGNDVHFTGLTLCRGLGLGSDALTEAGEVSAISGAAFVIRRELFETLGGFDDDFFLYMEDTDLSWRARLAGYRCIYVPNSIVHHEYMLRIGPQKTFYQERNRYLMLLKVYRWPTLLILLPALLLAEVITWGFVLLRNRRRLANKLRAYAWIARHWDSVIEQRRHTQALRHVIDRDLLRHCTYQLAYEQTGDTLAARLGHTLLDPAFFVLQRIALALIWW
jgi:GT2 family glycosyltransferase